MSEIETITPRSGAAVVNQLRNALLGFGVGLILVEVDRECSVHNRGYGGDELVFSWSVKISGGADGRALFLLFEVDDREYSRVNYGSWEALADISRRFYVTAGYLVVNDDGTLNLVETMLNAGIEQQ